MAKNTVILLNWIDEFFIRWYNKANSYKWGVFLKKLSSTGKKWLAAGILVVLAAGITLLATFAGADANGPARVAKRFVDMAAEF